MRWRLLALIVSQASLLLSMACQKPVEPRALPTATAFEDFTTERITSLAQLRQMAASPPGDEIGAAIIGTKFVITDFSTQARRIHYLDGRRYLYHDEWAWFRLLNGQPFPGLSPLQPHPFQAPDEARRWALTSPGELPDGLRLVEDRLYLDAFYDRALEASDRDIGAGSLIYIPARSEAQPAVWGFELEYSDEGDLDDVMVFFELLQNSVPAEVRTQLKWITRSPWQAEVAQRLASSNPQYAQRVMSYDDVTVPGETVVYTPGIAAGRLQVFRDLSRLSTAAADNILLLGALPEYLPQARGIVTSIPQTPLSHLNLLAKSRGILNVYRGGLLEDPEVLNLARSGVPVVLSAEPDGLRLQRISEQQYARWKQLQRPKPPTPRHVASDDAPYIVDLSQVGPSSLDGLAPLIGGKAVGMVHLLQAFGPAVRNEAEAQPRRLSIAVPDRPLAITIRAYREHLAPLLPEIRALLADASFQRNRKVRILALEGFDEFERRFSSKRDRIAARRYLSSRAAGAVAAVVRKGGIQRMIRQAPLPKAVEGELETIRRHFADYAREQGLRFRSSSTVEDVEGSSGAGLYDSNTGFFVPRKAQRGLKKRASLADALRKTWASYFSVEAFEERHEAGMNHLAGDMAVLVHARFDDELEASNGVFTLSRYVDEAELLADAHPGAVSVTNPPTDRLVSPESSRVVSHGSELTVERLSLSSEASPGVTVLSDDELRDLFEVARRLTDAQLERSNASLPPAQQRRSLVMDFEFRRVKAGWPALQRGHHPGRFVLKQMRPLERNPAVPEDLRSSPIPRDVLSQTRRIERRGCIGPGVEVEALQVFTDPNALPDPGYATQPLLAYVLVERAGQPQVFTHIDQLRTRWTPDGFIVDLSGRRGYSRIKLDGNQLGLMAAGGGTSAYQVRCTTTVDYAAPTELLRSYLE